MTPNSGSTKRPGRTAILSGTILAALAFAPSVQAQGQAQGARTLTGVVLRGNATASGAVQPPSPAVPGIRIQSTRASWTELAFSDGTSIVLGPQAGFTLQSTSRGPAGQWVLAATGGGGELRVVAADAMEVRVTVPGGAQVRIVASTAVIDARPGGSVTLLSGGALTVVRANGREETVRRPGFAIALDGESGGPQRRTRQQLVASVEAFGSVRGVDGTDATTADTTASDKAVPVDYVPSQNATVRYGAQTVSATVPAAQADSAPAPVTQAVSVPASAPATQAVTTTTLADVRTTDTFQTMMLVTQLDTTPAVGGPGVTGGTSSDVPTPPVSGSFQTSALLTTAGPGFGVASPSSTGVGGPPSNPPTDQIASALYGAYQGNTPNPEGLVSRYGGTANSGLAKAYCVQACATLAFTTTLAQSGVNAFVIDGVLNGTRQIAVGGDPVKLATATTALPAPYGNGIGSVAVFTITDGLGSGGSTTVPTGALPAASFGLGAAALASGGSAPQLADSRLRVVSDPGRNNPVMRSELQIASDGRSAATVTVGGLYAGAGTQPTLNGRLIGSVQPSTSGGPVGYTANLDSPGYVVANGSATLSSAVFSSGTASGTATPVGLFAARTGATATGDGTAGSVNAIGGGSGAYAGTTTLATSASTTAAASRGALALTGYASAVVNSTSGGQNQVYAVSTGPSGVTISAPAVVAGQSSGSALTAQFGPFIATSVGDHAATPLPIGAPTGVVPPTAPLTFAAMDAAGVPTSVVADVSTFAAIGKGAAMASVNGDMLAALATGQPDIGRLGASDATVAWGYFLGDLANQANQQSGNYTNLGFWVAGQQVSLGTLQSLTGKATYTGGMIGTAVTASGGAASSRVVSGSFTQSWDFARQTTSGTLTAASLDSATWANIPLTLRASGATGADYTGSGNSVSGPARSLSVGGAFFNAPVAAATLPAATGGTFAIRDAAGTYGANGIFVGRR